MLHHPATPWLIEILLLLGAGDPRADAPGIELPPVPDARLDGGPGTAPPAPDPGSAGPLTLIVTPGIDQAADIALDQLNRILTPFATPQVRTLSDATTQVDGAVLYLATGREAPVRLFINDAADPSQALSLTLTPRRIPPRELRLVPREPLPGPRAAPAPAPGRAPAYLEGITQALRALAQERVPDGHGLRPARPTETLICRQAGLAITPGQVLEGETLWLVTALVRNDGPRPLEIEERACRATVPGDTRAVAAWPRVWLEPGARVELYAVVRPPAPAGEAPARPSLRGPGGTP